MTSKRKMPALARALPLSLGLVLMAAVLVWQRDALDGVVECFVRIGVLGLLAVVAFHLLPLFLDAIAWRALVEREKRISMAAFSLARWIGEAVANTLPLAQIGGEVARTRALALLGVGQIEASASVVADVTVGIVTQLPYLLAGLAVLALRATGSGDGLWAQVLLGVGVFVALAGLLVFSQFARPIRWLTRRWGGRAAQGRGAQLLGGAAAVEQAVIDAYRRPWSLAVAMFWRLVGWFVGAGEFWLALHLLGVPIGIAEAIMLESLIQAVRSAAFMIPGGFGVQEAALVAFGGSVGLGADLAIGLSLIKRTREIVLGCTGLIAWYWLERRHLRFA